MRCLAIVIALLAVQQAAHPAFEVVTLKPNDGVSRGGRAGFEPGGRFHATNVPGNMLVQTAYGTAQRALLGYQLINVPAWLSNARYDIVGRIRTDLASVDIAELAQKGPVYLQSLLAKRFELQVHHEVRPLPRYRLVRAREHGGLGAGLRMTSCTADGTHACTLQFGPNRYKFEGVTIAEFAADLSGNLSQVVIDDTGLTHRFDLDLEWSLDQASDDKPSIFTAIQEQLGLKLVAERGPVDVVVIDHIEKPAED